MMHCKDCEFFSEGSDGRPRLLCDPCSNIKEPECLTKLQLVSLESMVQAYQATLEMYERLAPLQERMFRHMERELDEAEDADSWKHTEEEEEDDDDEDSLPGASF